MKKIIIIVITIFILISSYLIYLFIKEKQLVLTFKDNNIVEINTEHFNTDFIKTIKNGQLKTKNKLIKTDELGEYHLKYKVENYFKRIGIFEYTYIVKDTIPPVITYKKQLKTTENKKVDLLKNVSVKDNSNEEIVPTIEGNYNFSKPGVYKLYYVAKDSSDNIVKEEFTLTVKKKEVIVKNNDNSTSKSGKGYSIVTKNGKTYINGVLIVNKTYSLPSDYNPGLQSVVKTQANKMFNDAKELGYNMYIGSGFRRYSDQKIIYNNYVKRDGVSKADTYSARAGHSEHQSGLAFDICVKDLATNSKYPCINSNFDNTAPALWINDNCYKYGFIIRYPKGKTNETGYKYESWHLRYVGVDLATKLYNNGNWITIESYFGITSKYSS